MIRHVVGQAYRAAVVPPVGDVAEVVVNDMVAGVVWCPPYRLPIGQHLRPGRNEIDIRVYNSGANALAVDESLEALVAATEERFGRRFRLRFLDKAMDGVNSGLLAATNRRFRLTPARPAEEGRAR